MTKHTNSKADSSAFERSRTQKSTIPPETTQLVATRRIQLLWNRLPDHVRPFVALTSGLIAVAALLALTELSWFGWLILLTFGPLFLTGIPISIIIMVNGHRQSRAKAPSDRL